MSAALIGGEFVCRVCGLRQEDPIWGPDGQSATFDICACCGCEFGYEDSSPEGIRRHRERWLASDTWFDLVKRPGGWRRDDQLPNVPEFYFRVLPGLPGTGDVPVSFNVTGTGLHSEGLVVEFTSSTGRQWAGNFQKGPYGASGVFAVPGRADRAIVIAEGQAYVVEPGSRALVRTFGGQITDVVPVPERTEMIFGNGLWFECVAAEGLRWRTRRISWDEMMGVSLQGARLHGSAFNPIDGTWSSFDVDLETGEVTGGSYPPEAPQP